MVYIENRDGNANVKTEQVQTLKNGYQLLEDNGIKVHRSRMDAGSYSKDIIAAVAAHSEKFYIHANRCELLTERIRQIENWQTVEINYKEYQVASLKFTQFFEDKNYRLVVMREKGADTQLDLFTGDNFIYRCILTNDHESSEKEVIEYYNQRGACETTFDIMNNDFGWKHLACSDMKYNMVYLDLTAMIKIFYDHILPKISQYFENISPTTRLKRFIFRFISVAGRWIYQNRQWKLRLYTTVHTKDFLPEYQLKRGLSNARLGLFCLIRKRMFLLKYFINIQYKIKKYSIYFEKNRSLFSILIKKTK